MTFIFSLFSTPAFPYSTPLDAYTLWRAQKAFVLKVHITIQISLSPSSLRLYSLLHSEYMHKTLSVTQAQVTDCIPLM